MALFKTKEEKASEWFTKGSDLLSRKQYDDARVYFKKITDSGVHMPEAAVLKNLLELRDHYLDQNMMRATSRNLEDYRGLRVKYGVYDLSVDDLLKELGIRIKA